MKVDSKLAMKDDDSLIPSYEALIGQLFDQQGRKQCSMGTAPDLYEFLNVPEMWAAIERSGTRLN